MQFFKYVLPLLSNGKETVVLHENDLKSETRYRLALCHQRKDSLVLSQYYEYLRHTGPMPEELFFTLFITRVRPHAFWIPSTRKSQKENLKYVSKRSTYITYCVSQLVLCARSTTQDYIGAIIYYISQLVGALSPVNHRGLHQGYHLLCQLVGALSPVNHRELHQGYHLLCSVGILYVLSI